METKRAFFFFFVFVVCGAVGAAAYIAFSMKARQPKPGDIDPYRAQRERADTPSLSRDDASDEEYADILRRLEERQAEEDTLFTNNNIQLVEDPTQEQVREYIREVEMRAVAVDTIAISGCMPDPVIAKVAQGASLRFVNGDDRDRHMFVADEAFIVPPQAHFDIDVRFASGAGIYNYDCDNHFSVGTLWVL